MAGILVIKLGALGDFVQALGVIKAIRAHHPQDHITLLTTKPYLKLAQMTPYFNEVWLDDRPKWHQAKSWIALKNKLNAKNFARVYDLQNNDRTSLYFRLLKKKPEWVGIAKGASHRNDSPERTQGTAFEGHKQTLALAGIHHIEPDAMEWMQGNISHFDLKPPYVLIVPGASPTRPLKRWPVDHFANLCRVLAEKNYQPVLIGAQSDQILAMHIQKKVPAALDLTGKTDLADLPALACGASFAIGNDTGPMHMIAPTGCRAVVLYSSDSDPVKHRPLGAHVVTVRRNSLAELSVQDVLTLLQQEKILI